LEDKLDRYKRFFEKVFVNEGGFQKNPKDDGNYYGGKLYGTVYGITARDHFGSFMTTYLLYQKGLFEEAKKFAMEFYRTQGYWNPLYDKITDEALAFRIFDFGINAGIPTSIRLLQETLIKLGANLEVDGGFGQITLGITNKMPSEGLYDAYIARLEKYYRSLKRFNVFGVGWLKRLFDKWNR
jgi:lysozyme family protein